MASETGTDAVVTKIRESLRERGISQESLAAHLGMSQQAVSRRFTDEVQFTLAELSSVAELLDTPLTSLLDVSIEAPALSPSPERDESAGASSRSAA